MWSVAPCVRKIILPLLRSVIGGFLWTLLTLPILWEFQAYLFTLILKQILLMIQGISYIYILLLQREYGHAKLRRAHWKMAKRAWKAQWTHMQNAADVHAGTICSLVGLDLFFGRTCQLFSMLSGAPLSLLSLARKRYFFSLLCSKIKLDMFPNIDRSHGSLAFPPLVKMATICVHKVFCYVVKGNRCIGSVRIYISTYWTHQL